MDWDKDFALVRAFKPFPLSRQQWERSRHEGYSYCVVVENGEIVSWAGEKRLSDEVGEVVEVETVPPWRRKGYGKAVTSFATSHILEVCRLAMCKTRDDNLAMIRTAESIGYKRSEPGEGSSALRASHLQRRRSPEEGLTGA